MYFSQFPYYLFSVFKYLTCFRGNVIKVSSVKQMFLTFVTTFQRVNYKSQPNLAKVCVNEFIFSKNEVSIFTKQAPSHIYISSGFCQYFRINSDSKEHLPGTPLHEFLFVNIYIFVIKHCPANIYLFKINRRNARARCEINSEVKNSHPNNVID